MRNYATFDPLVVNGLTLSQGNLVVATQSSNSAYRNARSTIAAQGFFSSVEGFIWSPDRTNPSLGTTNASFGVICEPNNSGTAYTGMLDYPGDTPFSYGWLPFGDVIRDNNTIDTLPAYGIGDWIRIDYEPDIDSISFWKNGVKVGTVALDPPQQAWKYATHLRLMTPTGLAIYMNPGITPMRYPPTTAGDTKPGWWLPAPTMDSLLLGSEYFIGKASNDWPAPGGIVLPNFDEKYQGVIDREKSPLTIYDSVHFLPWGPSAPAELGSGGLIQLQLNDRKQEFGALLTDVARGARARLIRARSNDSLDNATGLFVGVVDHAVQDSLYTKQVYIRDQRDRLNVPLCRALYAPNTDPAVALKPRSMALGICRTYNPELVDSATRWYGGHDAQITAFGRVRYSGVPKVLGVNYNMAADGAGIVPVADVSGQITLESTSIGNAFNPVSPDYLAGAGDFTTIGYDPIYLTPNGWNVPNATDDTDMSHTNRFFITTSGGQRLKCASMPWYIRGLTLSAPYLHAGRTYAYKIHCPNIPRWGYNVSSGRYVAPATLYLTDHVSNVIGRFYTSIPLDHSGDYTGVFTVPYSIDSPLAIQVAFNDLAYGTDYDSQLDEALAFNFLSIDYIKVNEQANVQDNITLGGPGLDLMLKGLMIDRGPLEGWEYNSADAQAIDTVSGWEIGLRVRSSETPTVEQCVKPVLDSFIADLYNDDNDGRFRVAQLFAPESVSAVGVLRQTDVYGELMQYPDFAENLSSRASGCRNWDPISMNDMAPASFDPVTGIPQATRSLLAADFQWTVSSGVRLAERYRHAYNAEAIPTLLDLQADGNSFIAYLNNLYKDARNFYVGDFKWPFARSFKLMDVWNVFYPLYGMEAGRKLLIVGRQRQPTENRCKLILWGL